LNSLILALLAISQWVRNKLLARNEVIYALIEPNKGCVIHRKSS
jgi:hypothetical protein